MRFQGEDVAAGRSDDCGGVKVARPVKSSQICCYGRGMCAWPLTGVVEKRALRDAGVCAIISGGGGRRACWDREEAATKAGTTRLA